MTVLSLRFRPLAILSALLFFVLAVAWMSVPDLMLASWGVDFSRSAGLVSRRSAALYAGVGVMFFLARNVAPSPARSSLMKGVVVTCMILATLGVGEFVAGHASSGILPAAVLEVVLALAFLSVIRTDNRGRAVNR
ncbi:membrane protein [Dickeya fangzhongdai]|uniref:hypothetical protein n=1 Tax=Dickeya fangzhongdai TaxID=1778540 RepID=UPI000575A36B|nr:hypothetical protein [Dickeya fangzhongdai]KHN59770.1 membrane protein [Dickeya fangzhongdai]